MISGDDLAGLEKAALTKCIVTVENPRLAFIRCLKRFVKPEMLSVRAKRSNLCYRNKHPFSTGNDLCESGDLCRLALTGPRSVFIVPDLK